MRPTNFQKEEHQRLTESRWLLLVLLLAIIPRVLTVVVLELNPVSDYAAYRSMAINLLAGIGLQDGDGNLAFMSAGYPLFVLVPVFFIFGDSLLAAQLANAALGVLTTWLIYRIAKEAGASRLGRLLSAALFAIYLPSWIYAEYLAKENLMTPLMLGVILLVLRCLHKPSIAISILLGIIIGLLAITGNSGLAIAPILGVATFMAPHPTSKKIVHLTIIGVIAILTVMPWLMRNYQVVGEPVLNTNGGFNLYLGNNPAANGFFVSIGDTPRGATWHGLRKSGEVVAASTLKGEAIAWIRQNPTEFLTLSVKKAALLWTPPIHEGKGSSSKTETFTRLAWLVQYCVIVLAAVFGLGIKQLRTRETFLLWLAILGYTTVHAIFYVIFRYREPIMPVLIVLAGLTIEHIFNVINKKPLLHV